MSLSQIAKNKIKVKIKKAIFKAIKPYIPFIILIAALFLAICFIIDAIFVQEVQNDNSTMSAEEIKIKNECIIKSEYLNTCNNFIGNVSTNYLLDVDNKEESKIIEWSHLYSIMAFHNMIEHKDINESLLEQVSSNFKSSFLYEKDIIKIETTITDEDGNVSIQTTEDVQYILIESNTIIGHYKYYYDSKVIENNNTKTTKKVFSHEELIGEKYERLKEYLKEKLHIRQSDIDTDVQIIIQAANGYSDSKENTNWLYSSNNIIIGKGLIPKGMFTWPIPGYTNITSHFGMRIHPITRSI